MVTFNLVIMIFSLISVMFITMIERKFLGILNNRKGPNFFLFMSLFQSLNDFIKLITKKMYKMNFILKYYWVMMIFFGVSMFLMIMINYPLCNSYMFMYTNFFLFFFIYSLMAFFFLLLSYSSNSIFSMLSLIRTLVQIISYEVGMIFMFLFPLIFMNEMSFYFYYINNNLIVFFSLMYIFSLIMIVLSEMNRTPFDFLESETELVSGFNVEYFSSLFSFIFLIEYGFFLFMNIMLVFFFMMNLLLVLLMFLLIIWTRSFLPRYRYDKMLLLFWKDMIFLLFMFYLFFNLI